MDTKCGIPLHLTCDIDLENNDLVMTLYTSFCNGHHL